uniref:FecCD family ABC transporter permease n=1 Tax=Ndongobacter massiliensis TaxID=1871025 RepID=UPI0009F81042|nr:iron ABC transporter permease [Ndongobacter massiliensis]
MSEKINVESILSATMKTGQNQKKQKHIRAVVSFLSVTLLLLVLFFFAINAGSLQLSFSQIWRGLFVAYDTDVATIYDLRFPRIVISMVAGAALAVSGVLFQAVLKNPLADPGIIGISSGASFTAVLVLTLFPQLFFVIPLFSFVGGLFSFLLIYLLAWKGSLQPTRILLIGIAIQAFFSAAASFLSSMTGGNLTGVASIIEGNITQKTWADVQLLVPYAALGLLAALLSAKMCNLLLLDDRTARSIGISVNHWRVGLSFVAVLLASISTAVVGVVSFLGLIVPHIGRLLVGNNHKLLLPFSVLFGATLFLLADTVGRMIFMPFEVSAAVIMSLLGGPFFVFLLRRSSYHAK